MARETDTRDLMAWRPPMSLALVERGQPQFNVFCSVCHGFTGGADGVVVQRGFPQPPSFHDPRLIAAPDSHFVDVITNGHGVMSSYADRVPVGDRWAITAYIGAAQLESQRPDFHSPIWGLLILSNQRMAGERLRPSRRAFDVDWSGPDIRGRSFRRRVARLGLVSTRCNSS